MGQFVTFSSSLQTLSAMIGGRGAQSGPIKNNVSIPSQPIEETRSSYGPFRGITARHTLDLVLIYAGIFLAVIGILLLQLYFDGIIFRKLSIPALENLRNAEQSYLPLFIPAAVSVLVGALLTLYQIGKRRFASVDLFSMEMLSIVRLIAISDFVPLSVKYLRMRRSGDDADACKACLQQISAGLSIFGEDNFAEVFVKNTSELGWLDAQIVDYTTGYYTFVRSIHNLTQSFKSHLDRPNAEFSDHVIIKYVEDISYVIDTAMDNAYRAFKGLIQSKSNRQSAQQSALFIGTQANNLLLFELLAEHDGKYTTALRRNKFYKKSISSL